MLLRVCLITLVLCFSNAGAAVVPRTSPLPHYTQRPTLKVIIASNFDSQTVTARAGEVAYSCSLIVRGPGSDGPEAISSTPPASQSAAPQPSPPGPIQAADLSCTASNPNAPPLQVYFSSFLQPHVAQFTGVQAVALGADSHPAVETCSAAPENTTALLWLCGDSGITVDFQQPTVQGVVLPATESATQASAVDTAILAFGGATRIVIAGGDFSNNQAGTPILAFGSASLNITEVSVFEGNRARNGGAMHVTDAAAAVITDRSHIVNNVAEYGGGMYVRGNATVTVTGSSSVVNNSAVSTRGKGGGIYAKDSSVVSITEGCIISSNTAADGGGLTLEDQALGVILGQSVVHNNSALHKTGGGVYLSGSALLSVYSSVLVDNRANKQGGGIGIDDGSQASCTVTNASCIRNNSAVEQGGGLYLGPGSMAIVDGGSEFMSNYAKNGGGAFVGAEDAKNLPNATVLRIAGNGTRFLDNTAVYGGALNVFGVGGNDVSCKLSITPGVVIGHNSATEGGGGGLVSNSGCGVDMSGAVFEGNSAGKAGGAISAYGLTRLRMESVTISNSTAKDAAAAAIGLNAQVDLYNTVISSNHALHSGGAFTVSGNATLSLSDSAVNNNSALSGGAVSIEDNGSVSLTASTLANNRAAISGGAANVLGPGNPRLILADNSRCTNNSASVLGGCACLVSGGLFDIDSSSVVERNRAQYGGGVAVMAVQASDAAGPSSTRLDGLQRQLAKGTNSAGSDLFGPGMYMWPSK